MGSENARDAAQGAATAAPAPEGGRRRPGWAARRVVWLVVGVLVVAALAAWLLLARRAPPAVSFAESLPRDAWVVAEVRRPAAVLAELQALGRRLGYPRQMDALRGSLTRQLGFDPADPEALRVRGIDPEGALALFERPDHRRPVAALSVDDRGRFEEALLALVSARAEGRRGATVRVEGREIHTAVSRDGNVLAAWAFRENVAFLSAGSNATARVAGALAAPAGLPPGLVRAREALGEGTLDALAWADGARLQQLGVPEAGTAGLGLRLLADGLELAGWTASGAEPVLAAFGGPPPTEARLATLDADAVAAARLSVDLPKLWVALKSGPQGLPPRLAELDAQLTARGVDVGEDLLPLVGTPWLADLELAAAPDLTRMPALDARRTNPFEYLGLSVTVPVSDPAALAARLPDLAAALGPALVARVAPVEIEGREAWTIRYRLGEGMTFGLVDDVLLLAGGRGAFAAAARRLGGQGDGAAAAAEPPPGFEALAGEAPFAALLHVPNLLSAVHGLGVESFGGGPGGVMLRSAVRRLSAPLANVARVTATARPAGEGVAVRMELRLVAAPEPGADPGPEGG